MAYGQNQPFGLKALNSSISGIYNGQTTRYYIQSGYAWNIFVGDLVYLGTDGFIHNLFELGAVPLQTAQSLGVFNGCSYTQPFATNPIDPASPGRAFWPQGTVTKDGAPASCYIIDDPNVRYTIQSDQGGLAWSAVGKTAYVSYTPAAVGNGPDGNTITGQSKMVLNSTIGTNAAYNLRIVGLDDNPSQTLPTPPSINPIIAAGAAVPYLNAVVLIQNHSFASRPAGAA